MPWTFARKLVSSTNPTMLSEAAPNSQLHVSSHQNCSVLARDCDSGSKRLGSMRRSVSFERYGSEATKAVDDCRGTSGSLFSLEDPSDSC